MPYERIIALEVKDHAGYQAYRDAMAPVLARYGGSFRYDFEIAQTLASEADHPINRVFALAFPDQAAQDAFFKDEEYRRVREQHFVASTGGVTQIAAYAR